ncbi:DUF3048 domain-containing protein [Paenibacillus crassostreae]|uniref:Lipoprotein YerB n=1 Tax=Paenibacillus crassostreae TaxID=1763538 RepID=A0A167ATU2_9BACL|nr:DUF3048 domain-containing protein [Paenibacillus crassostreae]AOZ93594.1 hypothetical protein LPB68_16290 [Paenibacillus crassostreae]OAB71420.1 hypothetical protein PNBC_19160 [Paenibacillus crassostreae]
MKRLRLNGIISISGLIVILILSSCANSNSAEQATPVPLPLVEEEPVEIITLPLYTAPLTGLPIEEPSIARPIAVMINNAPAARPQTGLSKADIIYEVLAEGGITRLIAIYQSQNDAVAVGPIRSIRPYLIEIGDLYNGLLVHAGGSPDAYSILQKQKKDDLDEIGKAGSFFWRDKSRKAPHNLYSDTDKLREGAEQLGYAQEVEIPTYPFRSEYEVVTGENAEKVDITFQLKDYTVSYEYDESTKLYKRFINNKSHIDLMNNVPLETANVIIMGADHRVLDDVGRLSVDLDLGGEALILQHGKLIRGNWIHTQDDVIRFVKDNQEIPLLPGNTYINIVPNEPTFDSHVTVSNPSSLLE